MKLTLPIKGFSTRPNRGMGAVKKIKEAKDLPLPFINFYDKTNKEILDIKY